MSRAADLPGAAHLVLADGVVHLDPAAAVFEAMLEGWTRQQRTRFLKRDSTIKPRLSLVRRFAEVRPRFEVGNHPALWVSERCGRLSKRSANEAFENAREAAGLPAELDLHSLRHSMITHLVEFGYPERFVQDQAGHAVAATTAISTGVSDEYRSRLLKTKLTQRHAGLWEDSQP